MDELVEQPIGQLFRNRVRHEECPTLGIGNAVERGRTVCLCLGFLELIRQFLPQRHVRWFDQVEEFSRNDALRENSRFVLQRQLGGIAAFHEPREHLLNQCRAWSEFLVEMVLNEQGDGIVKTVRQRERRASLTASFAVARADVSEKFFGRICLRRFGES